MAKDTRKRLESIAAISFLVIAAALVVIDYFVFPRLEDNLRLVSKDWKREDNFLQRVSNARPLDPKDVGVWMSPGLHFNRGKTKAKRIIVVGDSYVFGHPLANINDAWWRQFQLLLLSRGYNDVEVMAICPHLFGNTRSELCLVQKWAKLYKPDILIWGYNPNDAQEFDEFGRALIRNSRSRDSSVLEKYVLRIYRSVLPHIAETTLERLDRASAIQAGTFPTQVELKYLKGTNLEAYKKTLASVSTTLKELGCPAFMMTLPAITNGAPEDSVGMFPQKYYDYLADYYRVRFSQVLPLFRHFGIQCFDITDAYIRALRNEPQFSVDNASMLLACNPADSHPGCFITHFYAKEAADILEKQFPQVLGPKSAVIKPKLEICDWVPGALEVSKVSDFKYLFYYPTSDQLCLNMPVRKRHVQLNFSAPTQVKTIHLAGMALRSAHIWLTAVDPKDGYDRKILHDLKEKRGYDVVWKLPNEPWTEHISTCKISADLKGKDNRLVIAF